ncbi:MAG: general stress protein [Bdellovibrionota bacterium]
MAKNVSVFGIYPTYSLAESAVSRLKSEGFSNTDISVLLSSSEESQKFAHENSTKAPEGAATGALSGATIGGVLGWLAGIGSLAIPGVGPFVAAGPIMAALAGAGVGGTLGGIAGGLIGMGLPEYEAKRYEGRVNDGGILLAVHADTSEEATLARRVLEETGAEDISKGSEEHSDDMDRDRRVATPKM